jgi:polysaccharide pyruvyl transferase CsaB
VKSTLITNKTPLRIFLIGYYGYENAGDDLLLKKTVHIIKNTFTRAKICVLYQRVKQKKKLLNKPYKNSQILGETTFCYRTPFAIFKTIIKSDLIVYGGGGIFQTASSTRSLLFYLAILGIAVLFNKKVYLLAQGIGPIKNHFFRWLTGRLLNKVQKISVRDQHSQNELMAMGLKTEQIILSSDLSYYKAHPKNPSHYNQAIGLSLRPFKYQIKTAELLKSFSQKLDQPLVFLDFQKASDKNILTDFGISNQVIEILDMQEYLVKHTQLARVNHINICMRYHACIWSSLYKIPFLALAYDKKVENIAKALEQEYIRLSDKVSLEELNEKYHKIKNNIHKYRKNLEKNLPKLIRQAEKNVLIFN